jgi:hypothetical protein
MQSPVTPALALYCFCCRVHNEAEGMCIDGSALDYLLGIVGLIFGLERVLGPLIDQR